MAGREATFGGMWTDPCSGEGNNIIGTEQPGLVVRLCNEHFDQVNSVGLITDPNVGSVDDFEAKYGHRPE